MAALLETCTVEEQGLVMCYLYMEGIKLTESHRRMKVHLLMLVCHCSKSMNRVGSFANVVNYVANSP